MLLKIDLHVHTVYSDGRGSVEEVIKFAEFKGLDGIALTDHDTLEGYFKAKEYDSSLLILPGFEVTTDAGHVLVLGLERLPPSVKDIRYEELIGWVRRLGGLTVLAHPAASRVSIDRWMDCRPDAVEVLNASYPLSTYFIRRGSAVAKELGLPGVGGSDAHYPHAVGDAYTTVEIGNPNIDHFIKAVKSGRVGFEGRLSLPSVRLRIGFGYVISKILKEII